MTQASIFKNSNIKHIHFIGIGGISMSGLAEILLNYGYCVSGSDIMNSDITQKLEEKDIKIYYGHSADNLNGPDLVVYTAAIKENNPELSEARSRNILCIDRATLLGQIMKKYPCSIAVSGTHGKTTTTSMITMIMIEAGLNPTVHIGGELKAIGGATKIGCNQYFIAEACEYHESFLKFHPFIGVILNIEFDHADYFQDIEHVKQSFLKFASLIPSNGYLVVCIDDKNISSIIKDLSCNVITYSLKSHEATWHAENIIFNREGHATFTAVKNGKVLSTINLSVPGLHNANNALAAIAASYSAGCDITSIKKGLYKFSGASRRFEIKGLVNNILVVDDYAHHPSEIKATLETAVKSCNSRIWCVFQPHTYTRTKHLLDEFAVSFSDAYSVILSDIYAAREVDNGEIHSRIMAERIHSKSKNAIYIDTFESIVKFLLDNAKPEDMIITMGAGDIYKVGEMFLKHVKE